MKSSNPIPPNHLKVLGKIVVGISTLERHVIFTIKLCSSIQTHGELACLVGSESLDVLTKKLDKLVKFMLRDELDMLAEFTKIRTLLTDINDARNRYIHSWWKQTPSKLVHRRKFLRSVKIGDRLEDYELVSMEALNKLVGDIGNATNLLLDFLDQHLEAIKKAILRRKSEPDIHYVDFYSIPGIEETFPK